MKCHVGGEECFCAREPVAPPLQGNFGALDRRNLANADSRADGSYMRRALLSVLHYFSKR
jgi:hypothetical protein